MCDFVRLENMSHSKKKMVCFLSWIISIYESLQILANSFTISWKIFSDENAIYKGEGTATLKPELDEKK